MNINTLDTENNNSTLNEVMNILNLSEKSQSNFFEKFGDIDNNEVIQNILKEDKHHRENKELAKYAMRYISPDEFKNFVPLFNDKEISLIAVASSTFNYYHLSPSLKKDKDIGMKMINALTNEGESSQRVLSFIESNYGENKKNKLQLEKYYKKIIKKSGEIYIKDINKCLLTLELDFPKYIEELLNKKILLKDKKSYIFSKEFYNELSDEINTITTNNNNNNNTEKLILEFIENKLNIPKNILNKYTDFLIQTIYKNLNISKNIKTIDSVTSASKALDKDSEIKNIENNNFGDNNSCNKDNNIENDLDYFYPECSYTLNSGNYHIEISGNNMIKLDENEIQDFTSVALKNFVKFYGLLYDIGLSFLWDKYKGDFITLCNNKVGLDYKSNQGITEGKCLSILNIIGKSIGIPENTISTTDTQGNNNIEVKCFKTVADAKSAFGEIKSTGKINKDFVMQPGSFSNYSIVEAYMIQTELINQKKNSINLSKFR